MKGFSTEWLEARERGEPFTPKPEKEFTGPDGSLSGGVAPPEPDADGTADGAARLTPRQAYGERWRTGNAFLVTLHHRGRTREVFADADGLFRILARAHRASGRLHVHLSPCDSPCDSNPNDDDREGTDG